MVQPDSTNTIFKLAADFVNNTSRHVFLTGRAGTGKTTFLKYIKEQTQKHAVVIAPTGVAAINAGGVTMHSFFQLPFGPFIPAHQQGFGMHNENVTDKSSLFKNIRFTAEKRTLLQELQLLIIDEVSMVRADMLDAMDAILRHFRKNLHQPFGGVQVLYIGDMYQLPPVVAGNEWDILQPHYDSPFFFSAKVIAQAPPLYIELKKIYRQNEQLFIDVLNRVRNYQVLPEDISLLNNRYCPDFIPAEKKYITLCTHNRKADTINNSALENLPGKPVSFNGTISGEFSDKALPTEMNLVLKEGAQVMFIKNDSGTDRKFFNGKLATVSKIETDKIIVQAYDTGEELTVEKETWKNIRYSLNKESNRIEEEELGSFTQYPLRLAWAITIHKSQGLTFEKAVIDAGGSFAAGQVYVALSRCISLEGMVLLSRLQASAITTDERVIAFAQKEAATGELQELLHKEEMLYRSEELIRTFDWKKLVAAIDEFRELTPPKNIPGNDAAGLRASLFIKARDQAAVALKFQQQLSQLMPQVLQTGNISPVEERVNKAVAWFANSLLNEMIHPLQEHIASWQHAPKMKKYVSALSAVMVVLQAHLKKIAQASFGDMLLCRNIPALEKYVAVAAETNAIPRRGKQVKGSSQAETLALFKKGNSITAIAGMRQLTEATIAGHLSMFIKTGEVEVHEILNEQQVATILPVVKEVGGNAVSPIKEILGDAFSFAEIRIVMNHWSWLQQQKVNA